MEAIPFGTGVYSERRAAHLLQTEARTIRRWWRGYEYRPAPGAPKRTLPPVGRIERDLPKVGGVHHLSFLEFAEMVVVTAFVRKGLPLQRVRRAADTLMHEYGVDRPFAYKRIFTDGHDVFMGLSEEANVPDLVKLTRDERLQVRAGKIDEPFVEEIKFREEPPHVPGEFYPRGTDVPIVIDPEIAFGSPVIVGTRVTTEAVAAMVRGSSVEEAVSAFRLPRETVLAAVEYEESLSSAA